MAGLELRGGRIKLVEGEDRARCQSRLQKGHGMGVQRIRTSYTSVRSVL